MIDINRSYTYNYPRDGFYYLIEYLKESTVYGPVGTIITWETWGEFEDEDQRDRAYDNLVSMDDKERLHYRKATVQYLYGQRVYSYED